MRTPDTDREDRFELPSALRKLVIPRDRLPAGSPAPEVDPVAVEEAVAARRLALGMAGPLLEVAIADPDADQILVAAARDEDLADIQGLTYAGAALAASISDRILPDVVAGMTIDMWVTVRGLPFAVAAFCVYARLDGTYYQNLLQPPAYPRLRRVKTKALLRLLEHVRAASDEEYAACMAAIEGPREQDASGTARWTSLFLFPDREDWRIADLPGLWRHVPVTDTGLVLSVLGADATAALLALYDDYEEENIEHEYMIHSAQDLEHILRLISWLPRDEAMQALIDRSAHKLVGPILLAAATRFPRRAIRLLAEAEPTRPVTEALRVRVLNDPELASALLPQLGDTARGRVEAVLAARANHPVATAERLPSVLVTPPWLDRRNAPKPVTIDGLTSRSQNRVAWRPGERAEWTIRPGRHEPPEGWQSVADALAQHRLANAWLGQFFVCHAPDELVRPLLGTWHPKFHSLDLLRGFAARYELAALPVIRDRMPAEQSQLLQPFTGPEIATFMADCLSRVGRTRQNAHVWFSRHAEDAVRDLAPAVVGKTGVRRTAAEKALRLIAESGWADVAALAADEYGAEAGAAIAAMLADDGRHRLPRVMPTLPAWAEPATLPPIVLADHSAVLPDEAVRAVAQMLAISRLGAPYTGLAYVAEACDRASLAAFAWELFRSWELAGAPSRERWAYEGLAVFGDDDTVRRLVPLIRAWPKENYTKRAIDGLDILSVLGSNSALSALNELATTGRPPRLRRYAAGRIAVAAENLGLSAEQLADRIVPDLGLAPDGSLRLDYGPRQFVVGFDEQLKPYVTDPAGKRLKTLPKPGVKDDAIPAQAAYERFSALRKSVRTLAAEQISRLERAMCARRSWSGEEFRELLLGHPLLRHVVRRLVWAVFDAAPESGGAVIATVRVAEDLSLADVEDEAYRWPEGAAVTIAHPLDLGDAARAWSDVFGDYEILQPFPQLGRPVFELSDAECAATVLTRFAGRPASPFRIAGLERRGWQRGPVEDGGVWDDVVRPLAGGWELVAEFSPGIAAWGITSAGVQDIHTVWIRTAGSTHLSPGSSGITLSVLDPVVASEILRDLTEVMEG